VIAPERADASATFLARTLSSLPAGPGRHRVVEIKTHLRIVLSPGQTLQGEHLHCTGASALEAFVGFNEELGYGSWVHVLTRPHKFLMLQGRIDVRHRRECLMADLKEADSNQGPAEVTSTSR
jgi:hypothetical protein